MRHFAFLMTLGALALSGGSGAALAAETTEAALPVHIVTATFAPRSRNFHLTGTIAAKDSYTAGFRDGGRVISVSVDVGDILRAGDEIRFARVSESELESLAQQPLGGAKREDLA